MVSGTVREAASHLAASFRSHKLHSPLHIEGTSHLLPEVSNLLHAYSNSDPAPKRQKAITPKLLRAMHQLSGTRTTALRNSPFAIITEIATAGFFFAMRGCEMTTTTVPGRTRRINLDGIVFRSSDHTIIPHRSPRIHDATRVTVTFTFQKTELRNEKRTQHRSQDPLLCPVRSLSSLVNRILATVPSADGSTHINTMHLDGATFSLTISFLLDKIRNSCTLGGGMTTFGFTASEIGTKSIRSGAAMALFLMRHSPTRIQILGRWKSDAFLAYIRPQVLEWTNNLSNDMLHHDSFFDATTATLAAVVDPRNDTTLLDNGDPDLIPRFHLSH